MIPPWRGFFIRHKNGFLDTVVLTLLSSLILGLFLGDRPLANPDEGRYVEISREMLLRGDFLTPTLNWVKYFEKPIFFYWLQSLSLWAFGLTEWAGRLISCVSGVVGVVATYGFGRFLYDRITGLISSLILLTTLLYFAFSHIITLDPLFSVLFSLCLLFVFSAFQTSHTGTRRLLMMGGSLFCGIAVLTKGLIAFFLPGLILFIWICLFRRWSLLKKIFLLSSGLVFLICIIPWHLLVSLKNPEFFDFYIIKEQFLRFLTPIHRRSQPFWFFFAVFSIGTFPWIIYVPTAIISVWRRKRAQFSSFPVDVFMLIWIGSVIGFFSLSHSKLIPYILPTMIPTALLIGVFFTQSPTFLTHRRLYLPPGLIAYSCFAFLLSSLLMGTPWIVGFFDYDIPPDLAVCCPIFGVLVWFPLIIYGMLSLGFPFLRRMRQPISLIVGMLPLFLFMSYAAQFVPYNTSRSLALFICRFFPTAPLYLYHTYPQDLPFYLNRSDPLLVVEWKGELSFGVLHTPSPWMLDEETFSSEFPKVPTKKDSSTITFSDPACVVMKQGQKASFMKLFPHHKFVVYETSSLPSPAQDYCLVCQAKR